MSTTRKFLPRTSGEYRGSSPWTYRFRKAIKDLKERGTEVPSGVSIVPTRTTAPQYGGVYFNYTLTGLSSDAEYWRSVVCVWDYDDEGAVYQSIDASTPSDLLGRQSGYSVDHFGNHAWETPGSKTVKLFAYNTLNDTWSEAEVVITVEDVLSQYTPAQTFVVAADGDFTGSPASDHQFTDHVAAAEAFAAASGSNTLLFKRGESYRYTQSISSSLRGASNHYYVGSWGSGTTPTVYHDHERGWILIVECSSFTAAYIDFKGFYNSTEENIAVDGETVLPGQVGGTGTSHTAIPFHIGFGAVSDTFVDNYNTTLYRVSYSGLRYCLIGGSNNTTIYDCHMSNWCDYGIFAASTINLAVMGSSLKIAENCLKIKNSTKDLNLRPLGPMHGPFRGAGSVGTLLYNNDVYSNNGWFSEASAQPSFRIHTDGALVSYGIPSVVCSHNICTGGDKWIVAEAANNRVETPLSEFLLFNSNWVEGRQNTYSAASMSYGNLALRNNMLYQKRIAIDGLNTVWNNLELHRNGGSKDPSILDTAATIFATDPSTEDGNTAWATDIDRAFESLGGEWVACAANQGTTPVPTIADTESVILALDATANDGVTAEATDTTNYFWSLGGQWVKYRTGSNWLSNYNNNRPSVYSQPIYTDNNTLWNDVGAETNNTPWTPAFNFITFTDRSSEGWPNGTYTSQIEWGRSPDGEAAESVILSSDPVSLDGDMWYATDTESCWYAQEGLWVLGNGNRPIPNTFVDPQFNGQFVPQNPAYVGGGPAETGVILDMYMNVRSQSNPMMGAIEAGTLT